MTPLTPSLTDSPMMATVVVTGANPFAVASNNAVGRPSSRLGSTKISAAEST